MYKQFLQNRRRTDICSTFNISPACAGTKGRRVLTFATESNGESKI
jgi:hypothetical protein